jgi:hypothetical protein
MTGMTVERVAREIRWSRRGFVRALFGGAGALPAVASLRAAQPAARPADVAVIQIWLAGGPSHVDLYDLKPLAPGEFRGPFRPIATDLPGVDVCELLPHHARIMRHLALIRSLHHGSDDHVAGTHWMQTGHFGATSPKPSPTHPSIGSVVARLRGARSGAISPYVHVLPELPIDLYSRQFHAAYLGPSCDPFEITMPFPGYGGAARFAAPDFHSVPSLPVARLDRRLALRRAVDRRAAAIEGTGFDAADYQRCFDLVASGKLGRALDLSGEPAALRARYGLTGWGQAALLCRRLVEAGATFVTLNTDSSSNLWDNHADVERYFKIMLPAYDRMFSALIEDLVERGLYERVIVLVWGEFGRTPRINARAGRDHWGRAGCALVGGGGLRVGRVIGRTTSKAEEPADRPVTPGDVLATLYERLGIDASRQFLDHSGRPLAILSDGRPIPELYG